MAETLETGIAFGYTGDRIGTVEYPLSGTQVAQLDVVNKVKRLGEIHRGTLSSTETEIITPDLADIFKEIIEEIIEEIKKAFGLSLSIVEVDNALKEKLEDDERVILAQLIPAISTYLEENKKRYNIKVGLWNDVESEWEEKVITIKADYENHGEKMRIWKELCDRVYKMDPNATFLVEVERLKLNSDFDASRLA